MLMKHFYARTIFFLSQFPFGVSRSWLSLEVLREDGNEWLLNKVGWKVLDRKAFWSCEASLIEIQGWWTIFLLRRLAIKFRFGNGRKSYQHIDDVVKSAITFPKRFSMLAESLVIADCVIT